MFSRTAVRVSARALRASVATAPLPLTPTITTSAALHTTRVLSENATTKKPGAPGSFARTDESITVEYPAEGELPSSTPVQGRGGLHMKRTLASFSLEGKVGVVTGGARGLGLVMGQGMVISGANLAIVDMNSKCPSFQSFSRARTAWWWSGRPSSRSWTTMTTKKRLLRPVR